MDTINKVERPPIAHGTYDNQREEIEHLKERVFEASRLLQRFTAAFGECDGYELLIWEANRWLGKKP